MQEFTTPMMKQYFTIKQQYQDYLLLYRMGDFYELFMEDAHIGAKVLDITLTSRAKGRDGRIPMAGVPYHAIDSYLSKLVKAGYKVAICEQLSEPNKYGIVDRDVVRIVTPGTILDEKALEKKENNYIISLLIDKETIAITTADISTGEFQTLERTGSDRDQLLGNELARLHPVECIVPQELYNDPSILKLLKLEKDLNITLFNEWHQYADLGRKTLKKHFGVTTLASFGIEDKPLAIKSAAALLGYLKHTQKDKIGHIKKLTSLTEGEYVQLDRSTMVNLELFSTIREHDTQGSLVSVLDHTTSAMGGRMLRHWILKPLNIKEDITARFDAVEELFTKNKFRTKLRTQLEELIDMERILSRLSVRLGNARDLLALKNSLKIITSLKDSLAEVETPLLKKVEKHISKKLHAVIEKIETTIVGDPPILLKEGGMIQKGISPRLDTLRAQVGGAKEWMALLEKTERERTGIGSLKVRFNKVFGFFIEVSRVNAQHVPKNYIRKQTLVNGERFITEDMKRQEEMILTAEDEINRLEYQLFTDVLTYSLTYTEEIQNAAHAVATLDCLLSFAHIAQKHHYCRPKLLYSGEIRIKDGRHPVVEQLLEDTPFVPNSVTLDNINQQLLIITGPNMAGKSVFIRQVALIVLMAHMGSFVPAAQAYVSLVDKIFVRSGASDVITSGLSTFMVEMVETAYILGHATKHSLIVMDEIGRGTSTYDGISIAWAVAQYLVEHQKTGPKTLFATHYHELQALESRHPNKIRNFHMAVIEEHGTPTFLHTLLPGGASASFGVAVAKLAGVPQEVIENAYGLLSTLEQRQPDTKEIPTPQKEVSHNKLSQKLRQLDIHRLTPLEALNLLAKLKEEVTKE